MKDTNFYATLKLTSGEEIFAKVEPLFIHDKKTNKEDFNQLLLHCPVTVVEVNKKESFGYKMEAWLKTTTDDTFIINKCDIITLIESNDDTIISMYEKYLNLYKQNKEGIDLKQKANKINQSFGYISTVKEARELLEKIWKLSN